jgi:hypothetical protein
MTCCDAVDAFDAVVITATTRFDGATAILLERLSEPIFSFKGVIQT